MKRAAAILGVLALILLAGFLSEEFRVRYLRWRISVPQETPAASAPLARGAPPAPLPRFEEPTPPSPGSSAPEEDAAGPCTVGTEQVLGALERSFEFGYEWWHPSWTMDAMTDWIAEELLDLESIEATWGPPEWDRLETSARALAALPEVRIAHALMCMIHRDRQRYAVGTFERDAFDELWWEAREKWERAVLDALPAWLQPYRREAETSTLEALSGQE